MRGWSDRCEAHADGLAGRVVFEVLEMSFVPVFGMILIGVCSVESG